MVLINQISMVSRIHEQLLHVAFRVKSLTQQESSMQIEDFDSLPLRFSPAAWEEYCRRLPVCNRHQKGWQLCCNFLALQWSRDWHKTRKRAEFQATSRNRTWVTCTQSKYRTTKPMSHALVARISVYSQSIINHRKSVLTSYKTFPDDTMSLYP